MLKLSSRLLTGQNSRRITLRTLAPALLLSLGLTTTTAEAPGMAKSSTRAPASQCPSALEKIDATKAFATGCYDKAYRAYGKLAQDPALSLNQHILANVGAAASAYQWCSYNHALSHYQTALHLLSQIQPESKKTASAPKNEIKSSNSEAIPLELPKNLKAEILCGIGEVLYERQDYKDAQDYFLKAIELWKQKNAEYDVLIRSMEGLGACYYKTQRFKDALPIYQELAFRDRNSYGALAPPNGWTVRILADLYTELGDKAAAEKCFIRSAYIFRIYNLNRALRYWTGKTTLSEEELKSRLRDRILGQLPEIPKIEYFKQGALTGSMDEPPFLGTEKPENFCYLPWKRPRIVTFEAAGLQWVDPRVEPIGVVVCVPGFGLHHGSFAALGHQLAEKGYIVISYDVRGFGAYTTLKARDRIDLEKTLDDLDDSFIRIRQDYPNLPTYILGESMGGAIALQFAALHPELIDGLVASVPSAKRYRQILDSSKVAVSILTGNKNPIDITNIVVNRATKKEGLRDSWSQDPEARFTATPHELRSFTAFVNRNLSHAPKIKTTPVLMFQGVQDLLIRPEGTIELFKKIGTTDKDLILIGKSEHLLLEQGQFTKGVLSDLCDWLKNHDDTLSSQNKEKPPVEALGNSTLNLNH
jgi:alpha-beta hydrolase superfamily lysophospholipase/Tfp pilus assembly protein PilF